jgi:parallel beta-helix repeat protein
MPTPFGMPYRLLAAALALAAVLPASAAAATYDVSTSAGLTAAAAQALPGDELRLAPGSYPGTFRPLVSGTPDRPIRVVAAGPGVVLDAGGAANAVKLISVSSWLLQGVTITGGVNQGVWLDSTSDIQLLGDTISDNPGVGVQLKNAAGTTLAGSTLDGNASAGVLELTGSSGTQITDNQIDHNGAGAAIYNGDGIQLGGSGALVAGNTMAGNGGPGLFEHGVYAAAAATGYTIADNAISDSGGADIKAAGSGVVRDNHLSGGTYGLVLASNPTPVQVTGNTLDGSAQHLVFVTTGARARLAGNSVRQAGRSTSAGDASAIFVNAATSLSIATTTVCYDNADNLGVAVWINDASRVDTLTLDSNAYCSQDPRGRDVAYNGTRVTSLMWRLDTGDTLSTFF